MQLFFDTALGGDLPHVLSFLPTEDFFDDNQWKIKGMWDAWRHGRNKIALIADMDHEHRHLAVLLTNKSLILLDPFSTGSVSYTWSFIQDRYVLFTAIGLVVAVFAVNELNPHEIQRSNRLFVGLLYSIFLALILSVIFN